MPKSRLLLLLWSLCYSGEWEGYCADGGASTSASRSSVNKEILDGKKSASGHQGLKRIKKEILSVRWLGIQEGRHWGDSVSWWQHRVAWSSHVHQLLWPVAEDSQELNKFLTLCASLLNLTLFPVAIISFHGFPWLQSQHDSSEEVFM